MTRRTHGLYSLRLSFAAFVVLWLCSLYTLKVDGNHGGFLALDAAAFIAAWAPVYVIGVHDRRRAP